MYLLDTVILSELRKRDRDPRLVEWLHGKPDDAFFLSVVSLGEIERGIARQRGRDPSFAEALAAWLDRTLLLFAERILPVDTTIARRWGQLSARIGNDGADLLIAATALDRGFSVVTRNVRHFVPAGVRVIDPFGEALGK